MHLMIYTKYDLIYLKNKELKSKTLPLSKEIRY